MQTIFQKVGPFCILELGYNIKNLKHAKNLIHNKSVLKYSYNIYINKKKE